MENQAQLKKSLNNQPDSQSIGDDQIYVQQMSINPPNNQPTFNPYLQQQPQQQPYSNDQQQIQQPHIFGPVFGKPVPMGQPLYFQQTQPVLVNNQQLQRVQFESQIKKQSTWFTACNVCFSLIIIFDIFAYAQIFDKNDDDDDTDNQSPDHSNDDDDDDDFYSANSTIRAAFGIFIANNVIWFLACLCGIWAIVQFKINYLRLYKFVLYFCILLEVIASIVLFAGFGSWSSNYKVSYVFSCLLTILALLCFIASARKCQANMQLYQDTFVNQHQHN